MKVNKNYSYQKFEEKYFSDLVLIIQKSFNKKVSLEYLKRKYNSAHLGIDTFSTIAFDGDLAIGFYGAMPQLFKDKETSYLVAHACDSYTIPGYQKKGVHYNLARLSYSLMQKNEVKFVYAYHSENTYHSTKKLDWKEHISLKRFHVKAGTLPLSKVARKIGLNKSFQKLVSKKFKSYKTTGYYNPFLKEGKAHQIYNSDFYNYKNEMSPHHSIQIEACTFYLKVDSIMRIGHVNFEDHEQLKNAIHVLIKICKYLGINEILFQVDPGSKLYSSLSQLYKDHPSWLVGYLSFDDSLNISRIGFNYADLDTF